MAQNGVATDAPSSFSGRDDINREIVRGIYGFVYSRVGNREAAERITEDVLRRAMARLDLNDDEEKVAAWLYRVAGSEVHSYWRTQSDGVRTVSSARVEFPDAQAIASGNTLVRTPAASAADVLMRLPESYSAVLSFRLLDALDVAETARLLDMSEDNVIRLQREALEAAAVIRRHTAR